MSDRIKLIEYLPAYVAAYKPIEAIFQTEQPETDSIWEYAAQVQDNNFVALSDANGVNWYERMIKLHKKPNQTLDDRKFAILLAMNRSLPYTVRSLNSILTGLLGSRSAYRLEVLHDQYVLLFSLDATHQGKQSEILRELRRIVPANLGVGGKLFTKAESSLLHLGAHTRLAQHVTVRPYMPPPVEQATQATIGAWMKVGQRVKILHDGALI